MLSALSQVQLESEKIFARILLKNGFVLAGFFRDKILPYESPNRKGVRKGQIIGPTRRRMWTTYLATIGKTPLQAFDFLGTMGLSYGSTRNLYTKMDFQREVHQWRIEIVSRFLDHWTDLSKRSDLALLDGNQAEILKIFGLAENYGEPLLHRILAAITNELNETKSFPLLMAISKILPVMFSNFGDSEEVRVAQHELKVLINLHTLGMVYHETKEVLGKQLANALKSMIIDLAGESSWLNDEAFERLLEDDSFFSKCRFLGTVNLRYGPEKN